MNLKLTDKEKISKRNCKVKTCREKAIGFAETVPLCVKHHYMYKQFKKYPMFKGNKIKRILKEILKSEKDLWYNYRLLRKKL